MYTCRIAIAYMPTPTNAAVASEMYRVAPEKNDQAVASAMFANSTMNSEIM